MTKYEATLRSMAEIYPHWADACKAGADALDIIEGFMHTPCFRPDEPSEMEQANYARMRELLFREQHEPERAARNAEFDRQMFQTPKLRPENP